MPSPDRDRDIAADPAATSQPAEPPDAGAMGPDRVGAAGEDDRAQFSRAIDEDRTRLRQQWIDKFVERQRIIRQWIALAEIADWCAFSANRASAADQEKARTLAYDHLDRWARNGEFERAGKSKILYLDPLVTPHGAAPRCWLTLEQLGYVDTIRDLPGNCYVSRELARQWLVAHGYPWPAHFDPQPRTPTDTPTGTRTPPSPTVERATQTVQAPLGVGEALSPERGPPRLRGKALDDELDEWALAQWGTT
jgi:hypothetical protein